MTPATLGTILAMWVSLGSLNVPSASAAQMTRFITIKGKIRIEGTSNVDSWQVESKSLGGFLEVGSNFPSHPSQKIAPGLVDARVEASVEVRSPKSVEKEGKPFSNKMDEIMHDALRARENPKIVYRLNRLMLKTPAKVNSAPSEFEARGQLRVAGVARELSMPVNVLPLSGNQIRMWGTATLKMTDFRIEPPSPRITLGLIKTDDEVKVSFEWVLATQH